MWGRVMSCVCVRCLCVEKRRAAWRTTEPSHTQYVFGLLLCCPISSSLSRLGGAVGGRAVRRGVCVCATATKDRSQGTIGFVLLTTKASEKQRIALVRWRRLFCCLHALHSWHSLLCGCHSCGSDGLTSSLTLSHTWAAACVSDDTARRLPAHCETESETMGVRYQS